MRSAKTQIRLGIRPISSVFACAQWVAKDPRFLHADSEDTDQTRLHDQADLLGTQVILLVLSCSSSITNLPQIYQPHAAMFTHTCCLPTSCSNVCPYFFSSNVCPYLLVIPTSCSNVCPYLSIIPNSCNNVCPYLSIIPISCINVCPYLLIIPTSCSNVCPYL